jgi:hypothetical protein
MPRFFAELAISIETRSGMSSSNPADSGLHPLEIGALGNREALQIAAQAIEAELDRTQSRPP